MTQRQPIHQGVIPPMVTPLTPEGAVDVVSLERLVAFLLDAGVSGLFALGSSGESAYLTDAQRNTVIDTVTGAAAGQVPVLAGCIETSTNRVVERAREAHKLGAEAVVATAPFYTRTHPVEIDRHFRAVRAAVDLPLLAYDIPVSVHVKLEPAQVLELAGDGVIDGLKDSSGDDAGFREVVLGTRGLASFSALTGHETVVDAMMLAGADGAVPGLANVDPHGYVRLLDACARGDWPSARSEQDRLARLFGIVRAAAPETAGGSTAGLGGFKTSLRLRGIIASSTMSAPMRELDADETEAVRLRVMEAGLL
ncbi:4-hydroxy-tetrahydrodipicolinate synthase [Spinactinospora alkalitolerans]|uniref:4-hydroxy-tetrahydrodipicolinate synthase n=1 Tax=Spinactinospora alkalitolerans TaxID=687207 RepID=A0A852TVP0_9ACTN|nr:dihydrodipicolinate synthase family protein [Spinactinospora alkalitolerans]NYE48556.1 4-hydroxy-tetrahydrodipicolinate synthase [Spinactinospora alkalitolerans]